MLRPRSARARRRSLAALVAVVWVLVPTGAAAQAPGFDTTITGDFVTEATPGTPDGERLGGAVPAARPILPTRGRATGEQPRATKAKRTRRCATRGRQRTCRVFVLGRHVRTCVRARPGVRERCKTIRRAPRPRARKRARARSASAAFVPSAASRAAVQRSRLRAVLDSPAVRAHIARVTQHGYQDNVVPAVGRFYYGLSQGQNPLKAWCSGTLILRGVVLTAAHCLYRNTWDERITGQRNPLPVGYFDINQMTFVPGHTVNAQGGPASDYGVWNVADAYVSESYKQDEDAHDWGLVLLAPGANGSYPGDRTGTFAAYGDIALAQNAPLVKMGYPASDAFARPEYWYGSRQYYCSVAWQQRRVPAGGTISPSGWYMLAEGCPMNGGSSGGPVFAQFADGSYGIIGVNNRGSGQAPQDPFGYWSINLWFDQNAIDFFRAVIRIWGGG